MKCCIKCKEEKHESDFYGLQGDCKSCTKERVRKRELLLRENPEWLEKERKRQREKAIRLGYKEKHKPSPEKKKEMMDKYKLKYPEKQSAKNLCWNINPLVVGNHLHHWNYNIEFAKDVIELSPSEHAKIHRFIKYDQKTFVYKDLNGVLLDTKQKHLELISKVLLNF
mgnify:CR=1 FL=1